MAAIRISAPAGAPAPEFAAEPGQKLSAAIWLSGKIAPVPLCNGLGLCGRCRIRFCASPPEPVAEERKNFGAEELAAGWRLACRHFVPAQGDLRIKLPDLQLLQATPCAPANAAAQAFLGFDLGTTSIQWRTVDAAGNVLASGSMWNPQAGAGADVISRLQMAQEPAGLQKLSQLALGALERAIQATASAGFGVERACIAANSAMTEILLQKNVSGLCAAPYGLSFAGAACLPVALPGGQTVNAVFPPLPAPFVGGDISAGLLALLEGGATPPFLLLDLGTNAELALLADRLYLASAPLGPAMEGIGPRCGQAAASGVITAFKATPSGLAPGFYDACQDCRGISATGYLSLLAILLNLGIMDHSGQFRKTPAMPLAQKIASGLADGTLPLPHAQFLTALDIEMLLKVKAALAVAVARVLGAAGLGANDLETLYLAGALGEHANISDLATLGFIPRALAAKTIACGNTSLRGACILAANPQKCKEIGRVCSNSIIVDLAEDPLFLADYLVAMRWGANAS